MNKVFSFAKIAGICLIAVLVLQVVLSLTKSNSPLLNIAIGFIVDSVWVAFFVLLIQSSAKRSPVIIPSWIALGAFVAAFISTCFSGYASSLLTNSSEDWGTISTLFTVSNAFHYIYVICLAAGFFWLSKFFQKGSLTKIMCIVIAIVPILLQIYNLTVHPWKIDDESTRNMLLTVVSVVWPAVIFIPQSIFLFAFSKLNKS